MNPKTKRNLLIGGAVVAVAAIWWFFGRKKAKTTPKRDIEKMIRDAKNNPVIISRKTTPAPSANKPK